MKETENKATPLTFTDANFKEQVLGSELPVLVDFWAAWCPPCQKLGPTIDELASEFDGVAKIGKLDVDVNTRIAADFNVSSIPTVLLFSGGKVVETISGLNDRSLYAAAIRKLLGRESPPA